MTSEEIKAGAPTAFELGRWTGHVEVMGREIGALKTAVDGKVGQEEFKKAINALTWLNVSILAAIIGLAFTALKH